MPMPYVSSLIVKAIIQDALKAGYALGVNDGEEIVLDNSADAKAVFAALFSTDEDYLLFRKDGAQAGWVRFVYGNEDWEVVCDHTINLEPIMKRAEALAEKYES